MNRKLILRVVAGLLGQELPEEKPKTALRPPRALIVEHDPNDAELLEAALRELGWECEIEDTTSQALNRLEGEKFDVAFADINFPGDMDGFQFVEELRRREVRRQRYGRVMKHMPVVYYTGALAFRVSTPNSEERYALLNQASLLTAICKPPRQEIVKMALAQCNGISEHPEPGVKAPLSSVAVSLLTGGGLVLIWPAIERGWLPAIGKFIAGLFK